MLVAVEGDTDSPVAEKLVASAGLTLERVIVLHGHGNLDTRIPRWCADSNRRPLLVLRDYDPPLGYSCVPELVKGLQGSNERTSPFTVFRIAERELEAWLLADRVGVSEFFRVHRAAIPQQPDTVPDPKQALVNLCRSSSSSRIRMGMVPTQTSGRVVGPEFTGIILEFAATKWDIARASTASPSLTRALAAMQGLAARIA